MVLGIYNYDRQQYFKWVQCWLNPTTNKLLGRHQFEIFGLLGICKLKWITFDQFFESLKVCFAMYLLQAKNCKVINL
jgi:hypothetical protein